MVDNRLKLYKVTYKEVTDDGFGYRTVSSMNPIYTRAFDEKGAKFNARKRIGKRERSEYLPGDGAFTTFYVVEEVRAHA